MCVSSIPLQQFLKYIATTRLSENVAIDISQFAEQHASKTSAIPDEASAADAKPSESTEPPPAETKEPSDPKMEAGREAQEDGAVAMVTEDSSKISSQKGSEGAKTEIPSSKSATEARERAPSAAKGTAKRELSAQSVDASPNLAIAPSKDLVSKSSSRRPKKVTRSSSLISGVMSRLSHVFSSTRRQSNVSCPSHESSSEPASRRTSKKSIDGEARNGVTMETAVVVISDEAGIPE